MKLSRRSLGLMASLALVSAGLPSSASAELDQAFGNTLVSHYPDGGWVRHSGSRGLPQTRYQLTDVLPVEEQIRRDVSA